MVREAAQLRQWQGDHRRSARVPTPECARSSNAVASAAVEETANLWRAVATTYRTQHGDGYGVKCLVGERGRNPTSGPVLNATPDPPRSFWPIDLSAHSSFRTLAAALCQICSYRAPAYGDGHMDK
jgi:hypothetical protein